MKTILLFLSVGTLLLLGKPVYAQLGFNSPAGLSPTEDLELYTRNGLLVQKKYQITTADPNATVRTIACPSGSVSAFAGILKDPGGDANYPGGTSYSCTYTISTPFVANGVGGIELVFEDLDTEGGGSGDYVVIRYQDGIERYYSGTSEPGRIVVTGSTVTIRFQTNSNATVGRGFRLRWRALINLPASPTYPMAFGTAMHFDLYLASFMAGVNNFGLSSWSTMLGASNTTDGPGTTAIGYGNKALSTYATAIGSSNTADGVAALALGSNSEAMSDNSVAIGYANTASGTYALALGSYVSTNGRRGSCIIGDNPLSFDFPNPVTAGTQSTTVNQFTARFAGGFRMISGYNISTGAITSGAVLGAGQNSWGVISDSTRKEQFRKLDLPTLIRRIQQLRVGTWNYKGQPEIRHYGPMAQDFYAAFGHDELGTIGCDTLIYSHDLAGVTLAGVQAVAEQNEQLQRRVAQLETERKTLQNTVSQLQTDQQQTNTRLQLLEKAMLPRRERQTARK